MTRKIELKDLRSQTWFGASGQPGNHKSYRTKQMGYTSEDFQGKPVIGILSSWSDLNSCHTHFPQRIEEIKRGVWQEGGFPVVMPTLSVGGPSSGSDFDAWSCFAYSATAASTFAMRYTAFTPRSGVEL